MFTVLLQFFRVNLTIIYYIFLNIVNKKHCTVPMYILRFLISGIDDYNL